MLYSSKGDKSLNDGRFKKTIFINEKLFKTKNISSEIAWFAGLFAADGYVKEKYFHISQSNEWGLEMMQYVKKIIGYTGEIKKRLNAHQIYFSSDVAETFFNFLEIKQKKSLTLMFPKMIRKDKNIFVPFVRGYFEGDGCIHVRRKIKFLIVEFAGTNSFLNDIKKGFPKIKCVIVKHNTNDNIWLLRYTGQAAEDFLKILYSKNGLYEGKKYRIWKDYLLNISPYRKVIKYGKLKKEFIKLYNSNSSIEKISKKLNVAQSTLYVWKEEYENPGFRYWENYFRNKRDT